MASKSDQAEKLLPILQQTCEKYPSYAGFPAAIVKVSEQNLYLFEKNKLTAEYPVSTSRYGVGQIEGSNMTPLGVHCIQEKIGAQSKCGEIFLSREPTHNMVTIEHNAVSTDKECITSRILWLAGLEEGINKGKNAAGESIDSYERYIYIHGTHEEGLIGQVASIGCVRMKNTDVIDLFDRLVVSSLVIILN